MQIIFPLNDLLFFVRTQVSKFPRDRSQIINDLQRPIQHYLMSVFYGGIDCDTETCASYTEQKEQHKNHRQKIYGTV